ncbi:hypothetical protein [Streptomyces sp. NBC_01431]|uniref:hypothetical protein n=1 Tax=Streptomyces sp. NBC_01431 TaxID=2903863 RepID=UPI002E340285|nr:hypothetical protein [Streptomyces sp. NBC_01431]
MNLQAQIELITAPQDFTRLCNAVLQAEYGTDFLPIDDDRADRGNDGYLKSEKRMFAAHCFKRIQNKGLDGEIRSKMMGDLKKAITLRDQGDWDITRWTFLCNYPIPEGIAAEVHAFGTRAGIDVSWCGPGYFAEVLQRVTSVRELFPNLMGNDILKKLDEISQIIESLSRPPDDVQILVDWVPRDAEEQRALISQAPPAWEYLLFASALKLGKERLEPKWRDFQTGYGRRNGMYHDESSSIQRLVDAFSDVEGVVERMVMVFSARIQEEAFGPPGVRGNSDSILHLAGRVVAGYEEILDWASEIRGEVYPESTKNAAKLAAQMAERPAQDVRDFIDRVFLEISKLPDLLKLPNPRVKLSLELTVTVDDAAVLAFTKEVRKIRRKRRF